ncbi:MAG: hypothetical protein L3J46_01135, partial [Kangiellaceae bacterium]|nr:hypothetical protein [Kangiellaceae bacterium]
KHSSADRASVTVQRSSNCIKWSVTDNGDSSNIITSNTEIIMGQGLNLMKNQILSLNGIFMLSTSNGFEIKAEFRL